MTILPIDESYQFTVKQRLAMVLIIFFVLGVVGYIIVRSVSADNISEILNCSTYNNQLLVRANYPSASGWIQAVSQCFIAQNTANLSSIDLMLVRSGVTPDFDIAVEIQGISSEGDFINGVATPNGTVLAQSINNYFPTIDTNRMARRFIFDGNFEIVNQTKYCVVFYIQNGTVDGDGYNLGAGYNIIEGNYAYFYSNSWGYKNTNDIFVRINGVVETEIGISESWFDNENRVIVLTGVTLLCVFLIGVPVSKRMGKI